MALEACGVRVQALEADPRYPDSTFVEDTAVALPGGVVLTRPGAPSRRGEVEAMRRALSSRARLSVIEPPGTLDGGDVCDLGSRVLIGISSRTNLEGARQLGAVLAAAGRRFECVALDPHGLLHLKSGLAWIGDDRVVAVGALADHAALLGCDVVRVDDGEEDGANCILVNGRVLVPVGCARLAERLREIGLEVVALDVSEFQKMDGGLSCLSVRFPRGLLAARAAQSVPGRTLPSPTKK